MTTIYKYPLTPGNPIVVSMPKYAEIVHIGSQGDGPVLWARVDPAVASEDRTFYVYATGAPLDDGLPIKHRGTCQTESGFVWHVYELPIKRNIGEMLLEMAGIPSDRVSE